MSEKQKLHPRSSGGRTPQPPARAGSTTSKTTTQPRSRASTLSDASEVATVSSAPTTSAIAGATSRSAARQPKTTTNISNNNNISSQSASNATRKPTSDEPATDDDDAAKRFPVELPKDEWLRQSELTLDSFEKQVDDAAKRTLKHQHRCSTMKDSIAGKEERMETLRGSYATLTRALDELEVLSNGDIDSDALDEMYNSIPSGDRAAALGHLE